MNRTLLASAICAGLLVAGAANAQTNPAPQQNQNTQPHQLSTVTVTGTHIRQAEIDTAQPVVTITHAEIQQQGFDTVAEILGNLTVAGTPPISREDVLASGENVGGYYVDLRNLGASRTLVLLNGHRLGVTTSGLSDLQQIPLAAIDRIEVLKDGASAIYGSDAIAGVVNIITRNRFNGAEASAYVGQYSQGDGAEQTYSFTIGANTDKNSVMMVAEFSRQSPVWARNRWFSRYPSTDRHPDAGWSVVSQYGAFFNYDINTGAGYDLCGTAAPLCTPNHGPGQAFNPYDLADYHPTDLSGGTADASNFNLEQMLQTGLQRKSIFLTGTHDFNEHLHFQADIIYNHRETTQQVAGYPFQPAFTLLGSSNIIGLSPDSYFNPLGNGPRGNGDGDEVWFYRRGWEVPRVTKSALTTQRFSAEFNGDFDIGEHNWNWSIGGFNNQNRSLKTNHGDFSLPATAAALGPSFLNSSGQVQCGTPDNPVPYGAAPGSCVPWNPFYPAGDTGPGSLTGNADLQSFLFPYYHDTGVTKTMDYSADITGSIVTLPGGDLAIAAGVAYRKESGKFVPDAFEQQALSTNLSSGPTQGAYNVKSYYVELAVPLLKDLPGVHALELDLAARHSKYSSFGATTNPKYSLTWRPTDDLLLRGTFAKGFRAPQIADLFGGISGTFDFYTDPCDVVHGAAANNPQVEQRCRSGFGGQAPVPANYHQIGQGGTECTSFPCQTGTQFFSGSSPTLQPENATSKTAGIVWSPKFVPGRLDLTVDWFNIRINNAISGDSVPSILHDCYVLGIASRCSDLLFRRDPSTGVIDYAQYGEKNSGWLKTTGWDFGVGYQLPQTPAGLFKLIWNTTYVSKLNSRADFAETTPVEPSVGWGANFRIRSNASLSWDKGPFGATWTARYYSSMKETCVWDNTLKGGPECNMPGYIENDVEFNVNRVGANTFHDLQVRYHAPWRGTISLGVNNLFNHWAGPMYSEPSSQYAYYGGFDIGRFYYLRYNQRF